MAEEPVLDLDDIQGSVVPGFKKDCQHFVFFRMAQPTAAKQWLKQLTPRLSSAREVREAHVVWKGMRRKMGRDPDNVDFLFVNCALSAAGLRKLAVPDVDQFDDAAFKLGLEVRATTIGDPDDSTGEPGSPATWRFGSGRKKPDVLVIVASDDVAWTTKNERELVASARANGLQRLHVDRGRVRPGPLAGHEHFGFKDGISIPAIRGRASTQADDFVDPRTWPPGGEFDAFRARYAGPGRQLVWPGHFLFGYPRGQRDQPEAMRPHSEPAGPGWAKNGSFLVYRRLKQDVPAFQAFLRSAATTLRAGGFDPSLTPDKLGALLVGRWPSGWPVMRDPTTDRGPSPSGENHFSYTAATQFPLPGDSLPLNPADPTGRVCPFSAHTRKVQPRDDTTDLGVMEHTFPKLLLRRGITFGPEMDKPQAERGLLFVAFQTSIVEQFEFVMNDWVVDPDKPHAQSGTDPLIGRRNGSVSLPDGTKTHTLAVPGGWVIPTGGEYLFAPGIRFFADL